MDAILAVIMILPVYIFNLYKNIDVIDKQFGKSGSEKYASRISPLTSSGQAAL